MSRRPDERAHAGPEHLDPAYAAGYESLLERAGFAVREREVRRGVYASYLCEPR